MSVAVSCWLTRSVVVFHLAGWLDCHIVRAVCFFSGCAVAVGSACLPNDLFATSKQLPGCFSGLGIGVVFAGLSCSLNGGDLVACLGADDGLRRRGSTSCQMPAPAWRVLSGVPKDSALLMRTWRFYLSLSLPLCFFFVCAETGNFPTCPSLCPQTIQGISCFNYCRSWSTAKISSLKHRMRD